MLVLLICSQIDTLINLFNLFLQVFPLISSPTILLIYPIPCRTMSLLILLSLNGSLVATDGRVGRIPIHQLVFIVHLVGATLFQRLVIRCLAGPPELELTNGLIASGPSAGLQTLIHERAHLIVQIVLLQILSGPVLAILAALFLLFLLQFLSLVVAMSEGNIGGEGTYHGLVGGGKVLLLLLILVLEILLFRFYVVHNVVDVFVDAQIKIPLLSPESVFYISHNTVRG